jgi:hypothetical protein
MTRNGSTWERDAILSLGRVQGLVIEAGFSKDSRQFCHNAVESATNAGVAVMAACDRAAGWTIV